jgi:CheY-like chemotaxis protein
VASEFLVKGGLTVSIANDGREALEWVQRESFDAVLMDLHMPVMDGLEATRRIRALPQGAGLPIIAMTAAAMTQDREDCATAGMDDHVAKPVDPQELASALVRWVKPKAGGRASVPLVTAAAANSALTEDVEALERALPGVSVRQTLLRIGGDQALYRRLLRSFVDHRGVAAGKLRALEQAGDRELLYLEAHNLKGEAGNLGLDSIKAAANLLESTLKSGETAATGDLTEALAAQFESTLRVLHTLLDNSAEESLPPLATAAQRLDPERLLPLLRQLVDRLQSRSLAARRLVGEVDALTRGSELAGEFSEIIQAVQQLHYEAALASLEQLLDRHQWRETT